MLLRNECYKQGKKIRFWIVYAFDKMLSIVIVILLSLLENSELISSFLIKSEKHSYIQKTRL